MGLPASLLLHKFKFKFIRDLKTYKVTVRS